MRKNALIWLALAMVLACTFVGLEGHAWVAFVGDVAAIGLAVLGKRLSKRGKGAR